MFPLEKFYHYSFFGMKITIFFLEETLVFIANFISHGRDSSEWDDVDTPWQSSLSVAILIYNGV